MRFVPVRSGLLAVSVLLAGVAAAQPGFELMPGAVVTGDGRSILVMRPDSGIAVLDAATGAERCSTRHAAVPLLARGSRVLAQTESGGTTLRLSVLDLAVAPDGSCTLSPAGEIRAPLPAHVLPAIDERTDSAFLVSARDEGAGVVRVTWSHRESPAFPESFAERGAFLVDLDSGTLLQGSAVPATRRAPSRVLPPVPASNPREVLLGAATISVNVRQRTDGTRSVTLERRSPTAGKRTFDLETRDARALRLASDDRSLLVSSFASGAPPEERWVWSIHGLDDGRKRAEVRAGHSGSPFWVGETVVVYREDRSRTLGAGRHSVERPVRLVARSVDGDGEIVWSYRIRDTAYRGVRPPRQPARAGGER